MKNKVTTGTVWQVNREQIPRAAGTRVGTNSPARKKLYPVNLFRKEQIPWGKSSRGTNSLGNKFPLTLEQFTRDRRSVYPT